MFNTCLFPYIGRCLVIFFYHMFYSSIKNYFNFFFAFLKTDNRLITLVTAIWRMSHLSPSFLLPAYLSIFVYSTNHLFLPIFSSVTKIFITSIPIIRNESRLLRQIKFSFIMITDCILDRRERARKENLMVLRGREELWLLEGWEHRSPLFYSLPLFPAAQIPLSFCIVLVLRIH